ncbi:unnamed protein product [Prorocentrum cordatum]|uniref:Uncharacterized protein n=1 Tax=Prorocentrum cordatum TaxID=2364126 RepID=A0ABN9Y798_9DINO|nr:unnamed protein product [Polarella glacialis]
MAPTLRPSPGELERHRREAAQRLRCERLRQVRQLEDAHAREVLRRRLGSAQRRSCHQRASELQEALCEKRARLAELLAEQAACEAAFGAASREALARGRAQHLDSLRRAAALAQRQGLEVQRAQDALRHLREPHAARLREELERRAQLWQVRESEDARAQAVAQSSRDDARAAVVRHGAHDDAPLPPLRRAGSPGPSPHGVDVDYSETCFHAMDYSKVVLQDLDYSTTCFHAPRPEAAAPAREGSLPQRPGAEAEAGEPWPWPSSPPPAPSPAPSPLQLERASSRGREALAELATRRRDEQLAKQLAARVTSPPPSQTQLQRAIDRGRAARAEIAERRRCDELCKQLAAEEARQRAARARSPAPLPRQPRLQGGGAEEAKASPLDPATTTIGCRPTPDRPPPRPVGCPRRRPRGRAAVRPPGPGQGAARRRRRAQGGRTRAAAQCWTLASRGGCLQGPPPQAAAQGWTLASRGGDLQGAPPRARGAQRRAAAAFTVRRTSQVPTVPRSRQASPRRCRPPLRRRAHCAAGTVQWRTPRPAAPRSGPASPRRCRPSLRLRVHCAAGTVQRTPQGPVVPRSG